MKRAFSVGEKAQLELKEGLSEIAQAVGSTMGPGGMPFGYDKLGTDMRLTSTLSKDGLTVLKALDFPDRPEWQAVLQYCRQASSHSVVASGDGTSSTIVLANAVAEAVMSEKTKYPQFFARKILREAQLAIEAIKEEAITGDDITRKVALTSCNGDEELADVVIDAIKQSSAFGSILVEKNPMASQRYHVEKTDGYSNCKGYNYDSTFALSAAEEAASSKKIIWENPYIAAFNGHLISMEQAQPIIDAWSEACKKDARKLVIVAYEVGDDVSKKLMVLNRKMMPINGLAAFVVKVRLSAEALAGLQVLRDIAAFCGIEDSKIIDGGNYKTMDETYLGTCQKISIGQNNTAFLGRAENHWVEKRVLQNESIVENARSDFDREITKIRNAELAEGLVNVTIGGGMMPELQERADRFDDASKAAQSCMRAGALPGAGCSYIRAGLLSGVGPALDKALRSIHEKVLENFGVPPNPEFVPPRGLAVKIHDESLNVQHGNAVELEVLDACETVCSVIQNGVSLGVNIATLGGYSYRGKEDDPVNQ